MVKAKALDKRDEIFKPSKSPEINKWADRLRKLRNAFAHPEQHSFAGGVIFQNAVYDLMNLINTIFYPVDLLKHSKNEVKKVSVLLKEYIKADCLSIRESGQNQFNFLYNLKVLDINRVGKDELILLGFKLIPRKANPYLPKYRFEVLRSLSINTDKLECTRLNGMRFLIEFPNMGLAQFVLTQFHKELEALDNEKKLEIQVMDNHDVAQAMTHHKYFNYWVR